MALVLKNRVKVTSTTTGTGTFTLGSAVAGYQDFDAISSTSNAWDASKASYSGKSLNVLPQDTLPSGLFFKPDGIKMYLVGRGFDNVYEYDLAVAWDITTATYLQSFSVAGQELNPNGLFFKPDGTKMYVCGSSGDDVNEYDLSTAWDISTASYLQNFSVAGQETSPQGLFFKPDGTKMYITGQTGDDVNEYDLGTPWDISTASYVQVFSVSAQEIEPTDVFFKSDGTKMYIVGSDSDRVNEYSLGTAWNISTASFTTAYTLSAQTDKPQSIFWKSDGSQFWIVSETTTKDEILSYYVAVAETYYIITDGTDFEAGVGTAYFGTTLSRDRVFASSNSNALVNWGAGDKDVLCGYPAEGTPGGIPFCDDSEINTDLSGWQAFRTALESGITGGQTYDNNGTNGIVSTYSLVYTGGGIYAGGVLAPNGDIHFIPRAAAVGQKISASGVVSTYSLVYTNASGAYWGGALAANGDIHMAPGANVGQKINASGVVSTYSLVYTETNGYAGGILAPNGDLHFVPRFAPVGQKVSAAGVVSTYSLVYTTGQAYFGGVLAPNGDIHFIPGSAAVGQKISAAGVVSTYSLVYTGSVVYIGGVLAPNGDIHFIPYAANRGQKISASGVVSTYSLITTGASNYGGGVLTPNGDIHFAPHGATRGQKVNGITGVVSTYSLTYTVAAAYMGGVLSPSGEIQFIPYQPAVGQRISTNPGQALGPGICLSSFLNKF